MQKTLVQTGNLKEQIDAALFDLFEKAASQANFSLGLYACYRPECLGGKSQLCIERDGRIRDIPEQALRSYSTFRAWIRRQARDEHFTG